MGAFIRHLNNQSIDVFQIFHHTSVEMYEILSHNGAGHSTRSFFYSVGEQEINNTWGMHSDRHCSCYSLRFYQFIPYLASYG